MMQITVRNLDKLQKAFAKFPQEIKSGVGEAMLKSMTLLQGAARPLTPVNTGRLRSSITFVQEGPFEGRVFTDVKYAKFIHDGTAAHWPPVDAIKGWADRHGIPAFLVARAISRKGMKAIPFFKTAKEQKENQVIGIFNTYTQKILNSL